MHAAIEKQQLSARRSRERIDGTVFKYGEIRAVGILGVPTIDAQLAASGPLEHVDATLTVRRAWFKAVPLARESEGLAVFNVTGDQLRRAVISGVVPPALVAGPPARVYFPIKVNVDDPLAYEFTLLDR